MRNRRARWSLVAGALAVAALPVAVTVAELTRSVRLLYAIAAVPLAVPLGIVAIVLARRALREVQITLGRVGGEGAARVGLVCGFLGVYVGITATLALGFFGLLTLFAS